jgi:colanic acid/amylovoran biosynthesis glycosyltransferase
VSTQPDRRIAFVIRRYPVTSQTFVWREVEGLRRAGWDVLVHRVQPGEPLADMDGPARDRLAEGVTLTALSPVGLMRLAVEIVLHLGTFIGTVRTLSTHGLGRNYHVLRIGYTALGVALWQSMHRHKLTHVHANFEDIASDVAAQCVEYQRRRRTGGVTFTWSWTLHNLTHVGTGVRTQMRRKTDTVSFVSIISEHSASQLMSYAHPSRWGLFPIVRCGVDLDGLPGPSGHVNSRVRLVCVARMNVNKGHLLLLEASKLLESRGLDHEIVLVGGGEAFDEVRAASALLGLEDRVTFTGPLASTTTLIEMEKADIVVLPSVAEGIPVTLMEAMALRKPVVSSRIPAINELVTSGVDGILVPAGRVDALADALQELITDPSLRAQLGEAGFKRVCEEFLMPDQTRRLSHWLSETISARPSAS